MLRALTVVATSALLLLALSASVPSALRTTRFVADADDSLSIARITERVSGATNEGEQRASAVREDAELEDDIGGDLSDDAEGGEESADEDAEQEGEVAAGDEDEGSELEGREGSAGDEEEMKVQGEENAMGTGDDSESEREDDAVEVESDVEEGGVDVKPEGDEDENGDVLEGNKDDEGGEQEEDVDKANVAEEGDADEKPDDLLAMGQNAAEDGSEESDGSEASMPGNETAAYLGFTLNQLVENDDEDFSFSTVPIFADGVFVNTFEFNPRHSDLRSLTSKTDDSVWYKDGDYADRISFHYTYLPGSKDYTLSEPTVGVSVSPGIEPTLESVHNDPENGVGSFTIRYKCKIGGPEKTYVSLHLQITKEHSFDTIWSKTCGHGRYEHVDFGFVGGDDSVVLFNADGTYGTEESHRLMVGPLSVSTELSARLKPPAWNLDFLDPYLESDSPDVTVSLRNTIAGSTMTSDGATKFSVMYECEQTAAHANIMFTVAIPPWDNMTASWVKSCGGTQSQALLIGTSGSGSYEIMQDGELNERYNVTEGASLEKAYGNVEEIDADTRSKRLYLTNSDDTSDIHIQTMAFTMTNPEVLSTTVEIPFGGSSAYLPAAGGTIGRKETKSVKIHFICKKRGESLVLVTLPTLKYKNVEFGFMKHCHEPQVRHHSGFLQTAGSILTALLFLIVIGAIGAWVHMRRRASTKYSAVPTNDRGP